MKLSCLKKELKQPSEKWRSPCFWSWNGDLEAEELERQMGEFAQKGVGGFIMHAREGLETPYLSDAWLQLVRNCAEKSGKLIPYIYDDDKWPSGMAGGKVAEVDPAFRACAIVLRHDQGRFAYGASIHGKSIADVRFGAEDAALWLDVQHSSGSNWYSGSTPADNLNPKSVRAFLDMTHEQYKRVFDGNLAGKVEGFFTDEPNFADFFAAFEPGCPWLPWTEGFEQFFERQRGYSILPVLPFLFYDGEHAARTRHDYWRTLTELFSQTYFKQLYDWCEENGVKSVGHLLFENGLCSQARVCGAVMPHYQYLHVPGIDILGERTEEYLTVKQCTSVANQLGRRAISETYGCSGWQLTFEGQKWLWDWQAVQGISIRTPHLAHYTIKGLRKRDYPPVFGYQAAWWEHNKVMEDYCARLSLCADSGTVLRSILVIHPQSSVWLRCGSDPEEDLNHFDSNMGWTDRHIMDLNREYDRLNRLTQTLLKNQCDFDFGDEMLLAEHGTVRDGALCMGQGKYGTVVVPEADTLFASTVALLQRFEAAGGRVLWLRKVPSMVEGVESGEISRAFPQAQVVENEQKLLRELEHCRPVKIHDITTGSAAPILTSLRKVEDGYLLLAVNNDRERGYRCRVELPVKGAVEEYDLLNGGCKAVQTDKAMGFYYDFAPADARVWLLCPEKQPRFAEVKPVYHDVHESPVSIACLGPVAAFTRTSPNALTIDRCRWKTDGKWSGEMAIWQAQWDIRTQAGFQPIHENGMPMRYRWVHEQHPTIPAQLKCRFTVETLPETPVYLALEEQQSISLFCNGSLCWRDGGWYKDRSIRLVQLENVRQGENELLLDVAYTHELELEDMYLVGDFAVDLQGRITKEPETLRFGDWCLQGYPHYAGSMIYHFRFDSPVEKARLQLGEVRATLVLARVNGSAPVYIPWRAANGVELPLKRGMNTLELEVVGSNRNLFGPLHQPYQLCSRIDWQDFRTEEGRTSEAPVLVPYGIFGQCNLLAE